MLDLSPAKVLVIIVVALVVLGPDKLPTVSRQMGRLWSDFRKLRQRLESEVRGTFPDMPSTEKITQAVRSPISFLDTLADSHGEEGGAPANGEGTAEPPARQNGHHPEVEATRATDRPDPDPGSPGTSPASPPPANGTLRVVHEVRRNGREPADDPGMN